MSTFSLTRGSEAALGMLASQAGTETLLLTQPARELRAELSIEPFTSDSGDQLLAVLFMREQRHSMTLQRDDGANVQHLADWIEAVANGTLDTAEAIPQRADPGDLAAATAAFHAAAHDLNASVEPAPAQDDKWKDAPLAATHINGAGVFLRLNADGSVSEHYQGSWQRTSKTLTDFNQSYIFERPAQPEQRPEAYQFDGSVLRSETGEWLCEFAGYKQSFIDSLLATRPAHTAQQPEQSGLPDVCAGKEQEAFEKWAASERMDMKTHPLHWLFLDAKTYAARQGWKAAIRYCRAALATSPTA